MSENDDAKTRIWDALKTPPAAALKEIKGGRIGGMTDINPQWRMGAMTKEFGPCGIGWRYTIEKLWTEAAGTKGEVTVFALVHVFIRGQEGENWSEWSQAIPGIGGNKLVTSESSGLHVNDECYKMAVTDALSVAFKALGVAADVYMGKFDSKYDKHGGGGGQRTKRQPRDEGLGKCPKCGAFMRKIKRGDGSGSFLGCQGYPDCKYTAQPPKDGATKPAPPEQRPGPRPAEAPPAAAQDVEEMCPECGMEPMNPDGICRQGKGSQPQEAPPQEQAQQEWRPQCCDRTMFPRASFDGGEPHWQCPRCKAKKAMTDEERKRVGL